MDKQIQIIGTHNFIYRTNGVVTRSKEYKNLVTTVGKNAVAQLLSGVYSFSVPYVNYGALGSSGNTPTAGNVQLGAETTRKLIAVGSSSGNTCYITQFYNTSEANGTHYEAGEFFDATATANSGILFSHWNIEETKTSAETLTIESQYNII